VTEYRPDVVLKQFWSILESYEDQEVDAGYIKSNVRIIVAGGDGTVTWVLGTIASLGLNPSPPVAIMPLGTGNDLSINLGWGKKFVESWVKTNHIYDTLLQYNDAHVQSIDYWNMTAMCPDSSFYNGLPHSVSIDENSPAIVRSKFWNYFSVGLDAEAAYNFHSLRENHPRLASSRMMNQAWYSVFTCGTGWFCGARPLERFVSVRVKDSPGSDWREVPMPSSIRALVLLNLQTYGGGRDIWGLDNEKNLDRKHLKPPSYDDGLIEVVGFRNGWHTAMVMGEINSKSIHAKRLAQCSAIELKLQVPAPHASMKKFLYMQLDGEPWKQQVPVHVPSSSPETQQTCTVVIEHGGKSAMLVNKDHFHGDRKVKSIIDRAQANAPSL
jgi:diacylglycerol kinase (ATP)